jgi:HlyD family secretion protein
MKMKRLLAPVAVITVMAAAALIIQGCRKNQAYTFETSEVKKGSIVNVVTPTGTLQAITSVQVGTQVSGIVKKLYVDFNSHVKKGQVLAELDKVALKSSEDQAMASLDQAKAEMEYQTSNYNRTKALFDKALVAQSDYDLAKYNYEQATASLKTAQANYDRAVVNLGYATIYSPIDGVVTNRAVEEGQTVASSFSTPEIFTIAQDLTQMKVEANVDESDIGQVKVGQRVEFTVNAYPDEKFEGTVSQIRLKPTTTSSVVTYTVIINAPNPDLKLLPGLTADINIYVEEVDDVLTVPYKAVKFTPPSEYTAKIFKEMSKSGKRPEGMGQRPSGMQGGSMPSGEQQGAPSGNMQQMAGGSGNYVKPTMVWVKEGERIHPVPVVLGSNDGTTTEVKTGLKEGDIVVTSMKAESSKAKTKSTTTASSPFMPKRPGSSSSRTTSTTKSK